jgi:hypothetical protein
MVLSPISISDLPHDILLYIFSMLGGDFEDNPFLIWNKRKKKLDVVNKYFRMPPKWDPCLPIGIRRSNIITETYLPSQKEFDTHIEPFMVMPSVISSLCTVSRDFNQVAMGLWKPLYDIHIRKSPYKRKYTNIFYRQKIYDIIRKYFDSVIENVKGQKKYNSTMSSVKANNSACYLESIKSAVESGTIDDERQVYRIPDLMVYQYDYGAGVTNIRGERIIRLVRLDLRWDQLISYRRKAKKECDDYSRISTNYQYKINSISNRLDRLI